MKQANRSINVEHFSYHSDIYLLIMSVTCYTLLVDVTKCQNRCHPRALFFGPWMGGLLDFFWNPSCDPEIFSSHPDYIFSVSQAKLV